LEFRRLLFRSAGGFGPIASASIGPRAHVHIERATTVPAGRFTGGATKELTAAPIEFLQVDRRPTRCGASHSPLIAASHAGLTMDGVSVAFLLTTLVVVASPGTGVIYTLAARLSRA